MTIKQRGAHKSCHFVLGKVEFRIHEVDGTGKKSYRQVVMPRKCRARSLAPIAKKANSLLKIKLSAGLPVYWRPKDIFVEQDEMRRVRGERSGEIAGNPRLAPDHAGHLLGDN